jgi:hypothetical protein
MRRDLNHAKDAEKRGLTTKDTKNELKKVNHKGHKEHIGRAARKIKFLRPLPFDLAQGGERVEPRTLRLNHPNGTAIAVPLFVTFVLFVVESLLSFGCGFAALGSLWLNEAEMLS